MTLIKVMQSSVLRSISSRLHTISFWMIYIAIDTVFHPVACVSPLVKDYSPLWLFSPVRLLLFGIVPLKSCLDQPSIHVLWISGQLVVFLPKWPTKGLYSKATQKSTNFSAYSVSWKLLLMTCGQECHNCPISKFTFQLGLVTASMSRWMEI